MSDTTQTSKLRASLPFLAVMFAVLGFAAPASAASLSCTELAPATDVECVYDVSEFSPDYALYRDVDGGGATPAALGYNNPTGTLYDNCVDYPGSTIVYEMYENYDTSPSPTGATDTIVCSGGEEEGACEGTGADLMLCTVVAGASGFFYDNAPAIILIGITIAIAFGFASWFIRRLRLRRKLF